jgi:Nuclear pore protein 84 / 107
LPEVERAIYAALCGNLTKLLPFCKSWHDYVWAYFRTMVDQRVENHIHVTFTGPRPLHPLPENYIENMFVLIYCQVLRCIADYVLIDFCTVCRHELLFSVGHQFI